MKNVVFVFGTRPEAIKLAPVIMRMWSLQEEFRPLVIVTGQHREMLDHTLEVFGISPHIDLNVMSPGQDLFGVTNKALGGLGAALGEHRPDWVVVQGDTTTAFTGALAAFYLRIPVAHVEAGLRTRNIYNPFPEEVNRQLIGRIASLHFAPTEGARENLRKEGVDGGLIRVTGNTSIDALHWVLRTSENRLDGILPAVLHRDPSRRMILVTTHRRESFGPPMAGIMEGLRRVARTYPDVSLFFPVHRNPNVRRHAMGRLAGLENVILHDPIRYVPFVQAMKRSYLILTDSGGVQEEAPSLGKPVLVLRETTERPEGIAAGTASLIGTDPERIFETVSELLCDERKYDAMSRAVNPYGDGRAAERITAALSE
ncbi:UDP-N-acetylglucosamine 2-epimerase (non-hydrolyzing) [Candidatus Poribacteria bacterium]|nr:UDP-N-acetylglucosamine 2-epimerase (non-hydrolyzing) [Candidatus Poribacteria bacterium]